MLPEQSFKWSGCCHVKSRLKVEEPKYMNPFTVVLPPINVWEVDNVLAACAEIISTELRSTAKMFPTYGEGLLLQQHLDVLPEKLFCQDKHDHFTSGYSFLEYLLNITLLVVSQFTCCVTTPVCWWSIKAINLRPVHTVDKFALSRMWPVACVAGVNLYSLKVIIIFFPTFVNATKPIRQLLWGRFSWMGNKENPMDYLKGFRYAAS